MNQTQKIIKNEKIRNLKTPEEAGGEDRMTAECVKMEEGQHLP